MIWLTIGAIGLSLIFAVVVLAACTMGGMADDALEAEGDDTIAFDPLLSERARLPLEPGRLLVCDEAMLLTWDEICRLPEVRP